MRHNGTEDEKTDDAEHEKKQDVNPENKKEEEETPGTSRIEALRAKLHAKIAEKRALKPSSSESETIRKRAVRRMGMEENRIKKKEHSNVVHKKNTNVKFGEDDLKRFNFDGISGLKDCKSLNTEKKKKNLNHLLEDVENKKKRLNELKEEHDKREKAKKIAASATRQIEQRDPIKGAEGEEKIKRGSDRIGQTKKRHENNLKSPDSWKGRAQQNRARSQNHQFNQSQKRKRFAGRGADNSFNKRRKMVPNAGRGRAGFEGRKPDFINKTYDRSRKVNHR